MTTALERGDVSPERRAVEEVFDALEERGFDTMRGDICCGGCAAHDLAARNEDGTFVAHFNEQSVEDGYGSVWVGFGAVRREHGDPAFLLAGALIVRTAHDLGVPVRWAGDCATKIRLGLELR